PHLVPHSFPTRRSSDLPVLDEADHYFNAPDRDFGKTDEAFRLRRVGEQNRITYKGAKQGGPAKTRTEIEIGLEPGKHAAEQFCRDRKSTRLNSSHVAIS